MSLELPDSPRKIGKHFTFRELLISELEPRKGKKAIVEYEYKGTYLKNRSTDKGNFSYGGLLKNILETGCTSGCYSFRKKPKGTPEEMYVVRKNGDRFYIGYTPSFLYDNIRVTSRNGASMDSFRKFLTCLENSMGIYED